MTTAAVGATVRHGHELLAAAVAGLGCDTVFGLIGEDVALLATALQDHGVEYVGARHENQAVAMAMGYAHVTDGIGLAMVTGGPGFTNALTAINTANRSSGRVLVLTGVSHAAVKSFPMRATAESMGVRWLEVTSRDAVQGPFRELVDEVHHGHAGVACLDAGFADAVVDQLPARDPTRPSPPVTPAPSRALLEDVRRAADLLTEDWAVSRPVVLAGDGARRTGAGPALLRLAELLGAVTATTLRASGLLGDDPFHVGVCGTYSTSLATQVLSQADGVLAFGASLNRFTTYDNTMFAPGAHVLQVDTDNAAIGRFTPVQDELAFVHDARAFAEALCRELEDRGHEHTGFRTPELERQISTFDLQTDLTGITLDGHVDHRRVAAFLDATLPRTRNIVFDGGRHATYAIPFLRPQPGHCFIQTTLGGSIGLSLGTGVGAAVARPEAVTLVGMGDASFFMSTAELDTAVRLKLPMVIMVGNDGILGSEEVFLSVRGESTELARAPGPSIAEVARSFGATAHEIRGLADLHSLRGLLSTRPTGPIVLDCRIDVSVPSTSMTFAFAKVLGDRHGAAG